ncbi:hypothetical protein D3229_06685 [Leucobacter aridicollis]|nr:hypothetical protein [Leucobacter aridicollis]
MSLIFEGDSVQLTVETPAPIEHFEIQLEAFRRLLTFAAQRPVAQLSMTGRTESGAESSIFARQFMKPGNAPKRDYRDFPLRLGNENTQNAITKWWEMSDKLRPLPQTVAGIIAQPGYVESDFVFLATVLDRLGDEWADVPNLLTKEQFQAVQGALSELELPDSFQITNTVPFEPRVVAVSELLPSEVWETLRIDRGSWIKSLKRHRNLVAHSSEQRAAHRAFMTGLGLRALRDATAVIVTLLMVQHLGVEGEALEFAADRLRVTRIHRYTNEELRFTNSGLG